MTGFTDELARSVLDFIISTNPYVGLFTTVGLDNGTGFVEVSGGSYARVVTGSGDWGPISGSAPTIMTNQTGLNFPTPSADWGTVYGWGLFDAPTGGNIGVFDYLGNFSWIPVSISSGSPGVFVTNPHGFSVSDTILYSTEYGGVAPPFSQSNLTGLLIVAHSASNTFDVTNSGLQVNTSAIGSGLVRKVSPQTIISGQSPITFPVGSLNLVLA